MSFRSQNILDNWQSLPEGKEKYNAYLCSREWSILKEAVRHRSGGVCERCNRNPQDAVHHLTYVRKYQEELTDLQAICNLCHEFTHAKSQYDPLSDVPLTIHGVEVKSVYLAGKITRTRWRDEICPDWSCENHAYAHVDDSCRENWSSWEGIIKVGAKRLDFNGPFWMCTDEAQHGCASSCIGQHASPPFMPTYYHYARNEDRLLAENGVVALDSRKKSFVSFNVQNSISNSDFVFAWIDSLDCFGTILEIGYARGLGKPIVIAFKNGLERRDLWLVDMFATIGIEAESPGEAWQKLWC